MPAPPMPSPRAAPPYAPPSAPSSSAPPYAPSSAPPYASSSAPPWAPSSAPPWPARSTAAPDGHGNIGLAVLGALTGAFVAGLVWWGIVATTRTQVTFVAIGVGWVVAQAVLLGCQQRNRLPLQAIAAVFTLASLAASEYFIQRTLAIKELGDTLGSVRIPLWDGFGTAVDIVRESLKEDPLTGLFWIVAVIAAIVVTGTRDALGSRS
jgi:hypothetical protein